MFDYISAGKGFGVTDKQHLRRAIKQIAKRDGIKVNDVDVEQARREIADADAKREAIKASAEEARKRREKMKREAADMNAEIAAHKAPNEFSTRTPSNLRASLGDWKLTNGHLKKGVTTYIPVAGVVAMLGDSTEQTKRITGTRVVAGATLAGLATGGIGAIAGAAIGGAARKKGVKRTLYVTLAFPNRKAEVIEVDSKDEVKARSFVATVNAAASSEC